MNLWVSPNEKWFICRVTLHGKQRLKVSDGWFADYPILYDDGSIGYDRPEAIPEYVKRQVEKLI